MTLDYISLYPTLEHMQKDSYYFSNTVTKITESISNTKIYSIYKAVEDELETLKVKIGYDTLQIQEQSIIFALNTIDCMLHHEKWISPDRAISLFSDTDSSPKGKTTYLDIRNDEVFSAQIIREIQAKVPCKETKHSKKVLEHISASVYKPLFSSMSDNNFNRIPMYCYPFDLQFYYRYNSFISAEYNKSLFYCKKELSKLPDSPSQSSTVQNRQITKILCNFCKIYSDQCSAFMEFIKQFTGFNSDEDITLFYKYWQKYVLLFKPEIMISLLTKQKMSLLSASIEADIPYWYNYVLSPPFTLSLARYYSLATDDFTCENSETDIYTLNFLYLNLSIISRVFFFCLLDIYHIDIFSSLENSTKQIRQMRSDLCEYISNCINEHQKKNVKNIMQVNQFIPAFDIDFSDGKSLRPWAMNALEEFIKIDKSKLINELSETDLFIWKETIQTFFIYNNQLQIDRYLDHAIYDSFSLDISKLIYMEKLKRRKQNVNTSDKTEDYFFYDIYNPYNCYQLFKTIEWEMFIFNYFKSNINDSPSSNIFFDNNSYFSEIYRKANAKPHIDDSIIQSSNLLEQYDHLTNKYHLYK